MGDFRGKSRMPGWPPRHGEIVRDVHAAARFPECRGGHPGIGRSYEICMQVIALPNAGTFFSDGRPDRGQSRKSRYAPFFTPRWLSDRPRADRGQSRKSRSAPFSASRWVLTDRGRTADGGVKERSDLFSPPSCGQ